MNPEFLCPECERLFGPGQERCPFDGARLVDVSSGLQPGTVIDHRYTIRHLLGKGGMGSVYVARQQSMDRDVAVKILHQRSDGNQTSVQRFFWEVRAARRLQSPHTITVFDFGQTERGSLFLAMELLQGLTLGTLLANRGPLGPGLALRIGAQICRSLEEAHAHGIIHRDLKPENIFLCDRPGEPVFVKVLDFGVAKFLGQDGRDPQTRTGTVFGTPRYMSPEQANSETVDARSDLYSVGILLYEMLAGTAPFTETNPLEILYKQVHTRPVPMAQAAPGLVAAPGVASLVDRLLAKRRDERPESAWLVRQELEELLTALPEELRQVEPLGPPRGPAPTPTADTEESRRPNLDPFGPHTPSLGVTRPRVDEPSARSAELALARRALDLALRDGQPRCLWITGEAGLGKRRFVEAIGQAARVDHRAEFARGLRTSSEPLAAIRAAFEDLLGTTLLERAGVLERLEHHPAFVAQPPERPLLLDVVDFLRAHTGSPVPTAVIAALHRMLVRISALSPALLDLGELDASDPAAVAFVAQLSDHLAQAPARLALTVRVAPRAGPATALRALADHIGWQARLAPDLHVHIPLKRLEGTDFIEFTQAVGRGFAQLAPYLHYLSDGVPADALGLIDALESSAEHLALARSWDPLTSRVPTQLLPGDLIDKAERVLAAVGPSLESREGQLILRHAALLGRAFDVAVLEKTLERDSFRTAIDLLDALLDSLVQARVLREDGPDRLRFDTGLMREIVLGRIRSPRVMRGLHTTLAETLSELPDAPSRLAQIARHWDAAAAHEEAMECHLRHARAERDAGRIDAAIAAYRMALAASGKGERDAETAPEILSELGHLGLEAHAFDIAESAFSTLADRARPDERLVANAESGAAQARLGTGAHVEASALFGSAAARYKALGLMTEAALAERRRAQCLADAGLHEAALDGFEAARSLYEAASDRDGLAAVATSCGELHLGAGRIERALTELKLAAETHRGTTWSGLPHALRLLAVAQLKSGALQAALEPARLAVERLDANASSEALGASLETLGRSLLELERPLEARPFLERALRLHEARGSRPGLAQTLGGLAEAALQLGQIDRASEFALRARDLAADEGAFDVAARALRIAGLAERAKGRFDRALLYLREAVTTCRQLALRDVELIYALEALALCEDDLGRPQDARAELDVALAEARAYGHAQLVQRIETRIRNRAR